MPAPPHALLAHPATPCPALRVLHAQASWPNAHTLHLRYTLTGELAHLRLPAPASRPCAADGLWQHTCLEAFIGAPTGAGYHEFNFSPSGCWAAYAFAAERVRHTARAQPPAPRITCATAGDTLTLTAELPLAALPLAAPGQPWPLGLSAVIESADGRLSYFALAHPRPQPDFHARQGWTASLPAPPSSL
ncbi:MAG: DOMON-like domain-containing protein [Pseudomonadota bacterium]|nr:DOMON-like domain-containing protein [Pseudomonadota bacterium]